MEDQIHASEMAIEAYNKLREIEPTHELLHWINSDEVSDTQFINRFWKKDTSWKKEAGSMVSALVEISFYLEVKDYLKEKHNIEI